MKRATIVAAFAVAGSVPSASFAIDVIKANNTTDLFTGGSWVSLTAPTSADTGVWDLTVTGANSSALGTGTTWLGIRITNPGGNIGINPTSGRTLTLGTGGIDLSSATVDLSIGGNGNLRTATSASQSYNVAIGRLLTINTPLSAQGGTTTISFPGAGGVTFNRGVNNGSGVIVLSNNGTGVVTLAGAFSSSFSSLSASGSGASVLINGQTVSLSALSTYGSSTAASKFELQSGGASFNGGIRTNTNDGTLIKVSGGAFSATSVQLQRTTIFNSLPAAASATSGFVVAGGTANVSGPLDIGTSLSSASALVSSGSLTVGGRVFIGNTTNTRWNVLQVSGGAFNSTDAVDGVVLSPGTSVNNSELLLTGGISTIERLAFGTATSAAGATGTVVLNGGTLYLGAGGIVQPAANFNPTITLASGTLGAKADWSSALGMNLSSGSVLVQAADANGNAKNITLNGNLSGMGGLSKSGAGTLILAGPLSNYAGATLVQTGKLTVANTGSISGSTSITVDSGATLENNGNLSAPGLSLTVIGTLAGNGTIGGNALVNGTLAPGSSGVGQINFGSVTLGDSALTNLEVGATSYDTLAGSTLAYDGTLNIDFLGGEPTAGSTFDFYSFANATTTSDFNAVRIFYGGLLQGALAGTGTWTAVLDGLEYSFTSSSGVLTISASAVPEPLAAAGVLVLAGRVLGRRGRASL